MNPEKFDPLEKRSINESRRGYQEKIKEQLGVLDKITDFFGFTEKEISVIQENAIIEDKIREAIKDPALVVAEHNRRVPVRQHYHQKEDVTYGLDAIYEGESRNFLYDVGRALEGRNFSMGPNNEGISKKTKHFYKSGQIGEIQKDELITLLNRVQYAELKPFSSYVETDKYIIGGGFGAGAEKITRYERPTYLKMLIDGKNIEAHPTTYKITLKDKDGEKTMVCDHRQYERYEEILARNNKRFKDEIIKIDILDEGSGEIDGEPLSAEEATEIYNKYGPIATVFGVYKG